MSRNPTQIRRPAIPYLFILVSLLAGFTFRFLGKHLFDPDNLFDKNPQNVLFLWISTTAFTIAVALWCTLWPLVRVELTRKDRYIDKETPPFLWQWYRKKHMTREDWLSSMVSLPSFSIAWIFGNLALLSHLEILSWLSDVVFLVSIAILCSGTRFFSGAVVGIVGYFQKNRE